MRNEILDIKDAKRIAVMGGTFDPIHYGHLVTAEAVRQEFEVEKVLFMPTGRPSHKPAYGVSHSEHRYLMCVLATVGNPHFGVSRMEIDRAEETYTIDTIRALRKICGEETKIYFITGADAIHQILTWKDSEILLTLCSFVAVSRPGYNKDKLRAEVSKIKNKYETRLHFLEVPALAISSTDIRNRSREGKTIKYLLPVEVEMYIEKNELYKAGGDVNSAAMTVDQIKAKLEKTLSQERFIHTLGVAREAVKLAGNYKADVEKAHIAALLHDCAKGMTDSELRQYCTENQIALDSYMEERITLAHSLAGAVMAKKEYGIDDEEVLSAIRTHTIGEKNMSPLDKIILVADVIEPNRGNCKGLEKIRKTAYADLDKATIACIEGAIEYNKEKGFAIHPLGYEVLEALKNKKHKNGGNVNGKKDR